MLSIITINKDNVVGLQKTIASLKQLKMRDFHWVFIDSNSSDASLAMANAFARPGDVVLSEPDSGIYNAMNKGVPLATGKHILFLNSGDTLALGFDSIASLGVDPQCELTLFGFQIRNRRRFARHNWWRFWSMPTSHQAIIYSKKLLAQNPFDEAYRLAADFEHYLRVNQRPRSIQRKRIILINNEPYGSDQQLQRVLSEYRMALIQNEYPKWWAHFIYGLKTYYLKWVLNK